MRRWAESHQRLYGEGSDYTDRVLELVTVILSGAGRVELEEWTSERRPDH